MTSTYGVGLMILTLFIAGHPSDRAGRQRDSRWWNWRSNGLGVLLRMGWGGDPYSLRLAEIEKIEHRAFDELALDGKILFLSDVNNHFAAQMAPQRFGRKRSHTGAILKVDVGLLHLARRVRMRQVWIWSILRNKERWRFACLCCFRRRNCRRHQFCARFYKN